MIVQAIFIPNYGAAFHQGQPRIFVSGKLAEVIHSNQETIGI